MNADDVRRLALEMPEAEEKSHFGKADFRVRNHIFCTHPDADTAVVKLTHEQQEMLASTEPAIFAPVAGGWGRQGWTKVMLAAADELTLRSALLTAWRNVAPVSLRKASDVRGNGSDETSVQPNTTDAKPAGPLASPGPWNMVAEGYEEITRKFLERFSRSGLAMLGYGSETSAIDVACGPGTTTLLIAPVVRHVTSVDFSAAMLDQLRRNVAAAKTTNVELVEADGQALPFPDDSFDLGISMFGLMFFPDRGKGFAELLRVLKPGGQALVSSWAPAAQSPLMRTVFAALQPEGAATPDAGRLSGLEDRAVFESEMHEAGFGDIRIEAVTQGLVVENIDRFWRDTVRGMAPLTLMKHHASREEWSAIESPALERLRGALTKLPVTLTSTAYLAVGRKG
jgi:ubiquinone/menaquinone biosynthesis C-methylase UbiE